MTTCAVCKSSLKLQICSGCHGAWYCGHEHQKSHWKQHKTACKGVQAAHAAGGVYKEVITPGTGPSPKEGARVSCHYVGTFPSGHRFDASEQPFQFAVGKGQVIPGWDKVMINMKEGEKSIVYLTPQNAYGAAGAPPDIPPNCPLVFEITLLSAGGAKPAAAGI